MAKIAEKMYGNSPKMERDEDSGKMAVKKKAADKDTAKKEGEDKDGSGQELPVTVRHAMERHDMHHAHEREHHMHDMGKHGSKKEMHKRHMDQHKEMMKRHERETGEGEEKE